MRANEDALNNIKIMKKINIPALICGGALALSLNFVPGRADEPNAPASMNIGQVNRTLAGTQWQLTSPTYAGLTDKPTLNFDDARISASVGLNRMGGSFSVNGQNIKFDQLFSTKMAGPPALMNAENDYIRALEGATDYEISPDGNMLTLRGKQILTFSRLTMQTNPLAATNWEMTDPTYAGLDKNPTLKFTDKAIGASVGLNVMGGGYKIDGSKIEFEQLISTMMAGPPALMNAESQYSKALAGVKSFEISPDGQTLTLRGAQNLTFKLSGRTAQGFVPTETKIINVAPQLGADFDGDKTPKYLQLEDLSEGVSWGKFTEEQIIGFDYQPGNRYQLRVQVERDANSGEKQLRLLEVFSQHYMGDAKLNAGDKILEVAPTKVDCVGAFPMKCLQVREVGGQWQTFYAPIEGFNFEEGSRYRLQVNVSHVANPPADGSSLRYQLVRVLDKMPVTY